MSAHRFSTNRAAVGGSLGQSSKATLLNEANEQQAKTRKTTGKSKGDGTGFAIHSAGTRAVEQHRGGSRRGPLRDRIGTASLAARNRIGSSVPPHLIDLVRYVGYRCRSRRPAFTDAGDCARYRVRIAFRRAVRWQVASAGTTAIRYISRGISTCRSRQPLDSGRPRVARPYNAGEDYARSQLRFELNKGYAQSELFRSVAICRYSRHSYGFGTHCRPRRTGRLRHPCQRRLKTSPRRYVRQNLSHVSKLSRRLGVPQEPARLSLYGDVDLRTFEAEYTALLRATGLDDFAGRLYKIDEETAVRVETSMGAARMRISCIVSATIGNATFRAGRRVRGGTSQRLRRPHFCACWATETLLGRRCRTARERTDTALGRRRVVLEGRRRGDPRVLARSHPLSRNSLVPS